MDLLDERKRALRDLICTMPAKTLGDAAVLISEAYIIADILEASEVEKETLEADVRKVARMALGAAVVVAEAAGLDLVEMEMEQLVSLRALRFHGVENLPNPGR